MKINDPISGRSGRAGNSAGFSLVEVTIAMAIAAVALVTLLGLLPQGMNTMQEAGDEAIIARIHQQMLNELQMADFDVIDTYDQMEFYYDSQGEEIGDSKVNTSKKGSFEHIYSARVNIPNIVGGRAPDSVGAGAFGGFSFDNNRTVNQHLRPVVIEIAAVGGLGGNFDWNQEENRRMIHIHQTNIVKMGQVFR